MSDAAKKYVRECVHPLVKDSVRKVFEALAHLVPEGHTTTPLIGMKELAMPAGLHPRTVLSRLQVLVTIGEVDVVDGGQGKIARYRIVHLDGERLPTVVSLPLRADLRQVLRAEPVITRVDPVVELVITSWVRRVLVITSGPVLVITSWLRHVLVITSTRFWRKSGDQLVITSWFRRRPGEQLVITSTQQALPLDDDDARAPAYNNLNTSTTTTTAPVGAPSRARDPAGSPPCPWFGKSHAWCAGRVHVPMGFHREELRKLARHPGESDADREVRLFTRYAEALAAIPDTEDLPEETEFDFWKRGLRSAKARAPTRETRAAIPTNDLFARAAEERRQRYGGDS